MIAAGYDRFVSTNSLDMSADEAVQRVTTLSPKPHSRACWEAPLDLAHPDPVDLSIIIPFYKTASYAKSCIGSVISQLHSYDVELILIDDGSPDECGEIIDSYRGNGRVIIHQDNQGVAAARNAGIQAARGEYLMFVDSDDILCDGAIQLLMDTARKHDADIVEGSHRMISHSGLPTGRSAIHPYHVGSAGETMFGYPWGKVIRRSLFQQICFPCGYWYEDTIISALIYPSAKVTVTTPEIVTLYRLNRNGLSSLGKTAPKSVDTYYIVEEMIDTCSKLGIGIKKADMLRQLGPFLYGRVRHLPERDIQALFLMAANLVEKHDLASFHTSDHYQKYLCTAFTLRQYRRWKWASILM
ncbi:MAG: glycosyltransferase family 2 protein [Oscillospiraceae bacterium]|nr:glycosyltransferase family 2 protein [Oscillospiraceae bacterium]